MTDPSTALATGRWNTHGAASRLSTVPPSSNRCVRVDNPQKRWPG